MQADVGPPVTLTRWPRVRSRYDFIDALRGLAALAVLYLHAAYVILEKHIVDNNFEAIIFRSLTHFLDIGQVGVIVFFAISGFVIPPSLIGRNHSVLKFSISRFFQLYPAYWVSIGMALYFLYYLHSAPVSYATIAINFTMLQQFFMCPNIIGLYWTLQIELIFYALCVALFLLGILDRHRKIFLLSVLFLCLAVILALVRFETHYKVPVAVPLSLSIMLWGSLMPGSRIEHDAESRWYANALTVVILASIPVLSLLAYNFDAGYGETWCQYATSYIAGIGAFYLLTGRIRLSGRLLSWLGRISYSIYLFHPIFVSITMDYVFPLIPSLEVSHLYIAMAAAMTIVFAHFNYVFVESPCIRLGRTLNAALESRLSSPVPL